MRWNEPGGGELLAFPRGPSGTQTFMVRIAANGTLANKENVLDMRHFAQIQAGMTEQEVLRVIGPRSLVDSVLPGAQRTGLGVEVLQRVQ